MQFVENVTVVGRSLGEKNVVVVMNENTGKTISLINPKGIEVEPGMEGNITFLNEQLESFVPVMAEELV